MGKLVPKTKQVIWSPELSQNAKPTKSMVMINPITAIPPNVTLTDRCTYEGIFHNMVDLQYLQQTDSRILFW